MNNINHSDRGLSLVELMIAVLIFAIGLTGVISVNIKSRYISAHSNSLYTAYNIAKNHIETIRSLSFTDVAFANETDVAINGDGVPDEDGVYRRTTLVSPAYSGNAALAKVSVSVVYIAQGKRLPVPVELTTVVFSGG